MTREQVKAIVKTDALTDQIMPSIEQALACGYEPRVWLNRKGHVVFEVVAVLSEGEGEREEEDPE